MGDRTNALYATNRQPDRHERHVQPEETRAKQHDHQRVRARGFRWNVVQWVLARTGDGWQSVARRQSPSAHIGALPSGGAGGALPRPRRACSAARLRRAAVVSRPPSGDANGARDGDDAGCGLKAGLHHVTSSGRASSNAAGAAAFCCTARGTSGCCIATGRCRAAAGHVMAVGAASTAAGTCTGV